MKLKMKVINVRERGGRPLFTLTGKNMQYTFHVDQLLQLEHLYWGERVDPNDDLQYLQYSNIALPFDPRPSMFIQDASLVESVMGSELDTMSQWKTATSFKGSSSIGAADERIIAAGNAAWNPAEFEARRRENTTWRLLHMEKVRSQIDIYKEVSSENAFQNKRLRALSEQTPLAFQLKSSKTKGSPPQVKSKTYSQPSERIATSKSAKNLSEMGTRLTHSRSTLSFQSLNEVEGQNMETMDVVKAQMDAKMTRPDLRTVGVNAKLLEFATSGTGDYRSPSLIVHYQSGSRLSPLTYKCYHVIPGKPAMKSGLPSAYCEVTDISCETLVITMVDAMSKLEVDLYYTIYGDRDIICRHSVVRNTMKESVRLKKLSSAMVDFETGEHYVTHLSGCWAGERAVTSTELVQMQYAVSSSRGTSSHQHNPFLAFSYGKPEETHGNVFGFNLVYSGNFKLEMDRTETGRARVNCGINRDLFEWGTYLTFILILNA